ncbi:MAG: hypothetical protein HUJ92_03620 [Bacteroidales bacterium]|nr:hypothetical protein [Bacteroidales bacterium]
MKLIFLLLGLTYGTSSVKWPDGEYTKLWEQAEEAMKVDLPQKAVSYLKEIEKKAIAAGDTLELYDVLDVISNNLRSYNWKEARVYGNRVSQLEQTLENDLDANIKKYASHPKLDILLLWKVNNMKWEEDRQMDHNSENYLKIKQLCEEIMKTYPKSPRLDDFREIVAGMDSKDISMECCDAFSPGSEQLFRFSTKNVNQINIELFKLGTDSSTLVGNFKITSLQDKYNIAESSSTRIPFSEKGIYKVVASCGDASVSKTLYVSNVAAARRQIDGKWQIYVADVNTGKPADEVTVTAVTTMKNSTPFIKGGKNDNVVVSEKSYRLDGFTDLDQKLMNDKGYSSILVLDVNGDSFSYQNIIDRPARYRNEEKDKSLVKGAVVFTDRKLYRPEDEIQFKVICYSTRGDSGEVMAKENVTVRLYSPKHQLVGNSILLKTNNMGSASGSFRIPKDSENGRYTINVNNLGYASFRVEEYSTPDFFIDPEIDKGTYSFDDVLTAKGFVKGYAGVPVSSAEIEYEVMAASCSSPRDYDYYYVSEKIAEGKINTGADGSYAINFKAKRIGDKAVKNVRYQVFVKATNPVGGTCEEFQTLYAAESPVFLSAAFAQSSMQDSMMLVDKNKNNGFVINAKNLADGDVDIDINYTLSKDNKIVKKGVTRYGQKIAVDFASMESGSYRLDYSVQWRGRKIEDKCTFALFALDDKKSPIAADLFFYPVEESGIGFMIGTSCDDLYVEAEVIDRDKVLHRIPIHLCNESRYFEFPYKDKYNDAVILSIFGFRNGKSLNEVHTFKRPKDKTTFDLKISSFRDKTTPKTNETFDVVGPSGAELAVSIFDVTTDRYGSNSFWFNPFYEYNTYAPNISTNLRWTSTVRFYDKTGIRTKSELGALRRGGAMEIESDKMMATENMAAPVLTMDMAAGAFEESDTAYSMNNKEANVEAEEESLDNADVRTDFGQTLAFIPHLQIGLLGKESVSFTTTDALSTFRVMVFGHTKKMHRGYVEKSFIVAKEVMVNCNLPQFVTASDKITFRANIANSSDKEHSGKAVIEINDAETGEKIAGQSKELSLLSGAQSDVAFDVDIPEGVSKLEVKIGFNGKNISDGERHIIEVIPSAQKVTEAVAFVIGGEMNRKMAEKEAEQRFGRFHGTMEYREYTTLSAVKDAVKNINKPLNKNVIGWIEYLWLNSVKAYIDNGAPKVDVEAAVTNIKAAQNGDGGFGWFPQMLSSDWLTLMFLEKMSQLDNLGIQDMKPFDEIRKKAVSYIDGEIESELGDKEIYYDMLVSLYYVRLAYGQYQMPEKVATGLKTLVSWLDKGWIKQPILEKVKICRILLDCKTSYGFNAKDIDKILNPIVASLKDYAVVNKTLGVYYPNAVMPFRGLLHTEIYAHSMLLDLFNRLGEKEMVRGLTQWLMLQKHNQAWENNVATCDAVYALLSNKVEDVKFGAVYYTYTAPMLSLDETGKELKVKRTFVLDGKTLKEGDRLRKGDKVTMNLEVYSDENRSFVEMTAMRPACLYPVDERSYPMWTSYFEQKASCSKYYFQTLAEEDTHYSQDFYVTQDGIFNSGTVTIESTYAPEYRGHTGAYKIEVRQK